MSQTLEEVLASWREEAAVLRRAGHPGEAELRLRLAKEVQDAAVEFLEWVNEEDAMARSGRGIDFFRSRFPEWERAGHAKKVSRRRWYRLVIVPRRANAGAAYEAGRKGEAA